MQLKLCTYIRIWNFCVLKGCSCDYMALVGGLARWFVSCTPRFEVVHNPLKAIRQNATLYGFIEGWKLFIVFIQQFRCYNQNCNVHIGVCTSKFCLKSHPPFFFWFNRRRRKDKYFCLLTHRLRDWTDKDKLIFFTGNVLSFPASPSTLDLAGLLPGEVASFSGLSLGTPPPLTKPYESGGQSTNPPEPPAVFQPSVPGLLGLVCRAVPWLIGWHGADKTGQSIHQHQQPHLAFSVIPEAGNCLSGHVVFYYQNVRLCGNMFVFLHGGSLSGGSGWAQSSCGVSWQWQYTGNTYQF